MKRFRLSTAFAIIVCLAVILSGCKIGSSSAEGQTKIFNLYAGDVSQQLKTGTTLYSWGYGLWDEEAGKPASPATVPGPEIRVNEGDHVKIVFHNRQKEPHTIHFHGIDNSFEGDGTPDISQEETEMNGTFTYEFDADHAGTYFYHCHVEPDRHPEMGLYGAIIVEPKKKADYDGEYVLMLGERDPKLSLAEATEAGFPAGTGAEHERLEGEYDTINRKAAFYTINGKMDEAIPPLQVKEGGKYLIRIINAGAEVHSIHTHGHHFRVVATDGRPLTEETNKDTITVGPGERYDIELTADNPGVWPLHCHMGPHAVHGMHTFIVYEGYEGKLKAHSHSGSSEASDNSDAQIAAGIKTVIDHIEQLHRNIEKGDTKDLAVSGDKLLEEWNQFEEQVKAKNPDWYKEVEKYLVPVVAGVKQEPLDGATLGAMLDKLTTVMHSILEQVSTSSAETAHHH